MQTAHLLHHLLERSAHRHPDAGALTAAGQTLSYDTLNALVGRVANGLHALGLARAERVGIFLDKRIETVAAMFGTSCAGGAFVPINPILKADQVVHILSDCNVRALVTSPERLRSLQAHLSHCHDLRHIVLVGDVAEPALDGIGLHRWQDLLDAPEAAHPRIIDADMAAILYTSGSTGRPKGVVLSHRNMVVGAQSVVSYLENGPEDVLLAALPLSFDAGLSQLTTGFFAGARVVLLNYLLPRDVIRALEREKVTGLTAVPPLWIQLSQLQWPDSIAAHLRYFANTGGHMPAETLARLRAQVPEARPYLMYGLTEAFRATYLPPEQVDRRPGSIGKAIPNAEVLVLREDGSECAPNEPGELVQRGALVSLGYWNDAERTAERFRPLPALVAARERALVTPELAVFSGDTVKRDEDGYLYFIGRRDEMIKTSGYRVSPGEVEEILYATRMVGECAAFGVADTSLGQVIHAVVTPAHETPIDVAALIAECRQRMPGYMVPSHIKVVDAPLPRNQNGKIDRKRLASEH